MRGDGMDSVYIIMGWWGRALRGSGQSAAARIRCWSLVDGLIVKEYYELFYVYVNASIYVILTSKAFIILLNPSST